MEFVPYPPTPTFDKFKKHVGYTRTYGNGAEDIPEPLSEARMVTFVGTVKLHGTNASIVIRNSSKPVVQYQSRNRVITTKEDNSNAAAFLTTIPLDSLLTEILRIWGTDTYQEIFIIGEWAGRGIQKGVAITGVNRFFAIFNIRIDGHWVDIRKYKTVHSPARRVYNIANFQNFEVTVDIDDDEDWKRSYKLMTKLSREVAKKCPVAEALLQEQIGVPTGLRDTVLNGEGVVWTAAPTPDRDTELYNFKIKSEEFSAVSKAPKSKNTAANDEGAAAFADFALGERRFEQGIEYLQEMGKDPNDMSSTSDYIAWVLEDALKEEGWRLEEKDESGSTPFERGVTERNVRKFMGQKARAWFIERHNRMSI